VGRRFAPAHVSALALLAVAAAFASSTRAESASWHGEALLAVTSVGGYYPELNISLDLPVGGAAPAQVVFYVPRGFPIYPDRAPGSSVGSVQLTAMDDSYGSYTDSTLSGDIVAQSPSTTAVSCTPGPYVGVWQLELSLLGQPFDVPIYVEPTTAGDPPGSATKLVLCAPMLPSADPSSGRAFPISTLSLSLDDITKPSSHGSYVWRALVTPLAVDRKTPRPAHIYELRASVPVPNLLTLNGKVVRGARAATLSGRLTGNGAPRSHVSIAIVARVRRVTPTGVQFDDHIVAHATTTSSGAFRARAPLKGPTTFSAVAEQTVTRCRGAAVAPAGCVSTTTAPTESEPLVLTP
jgi:hypothetical protein